MVNSAPRSAKEQSRGSAPHFMERAWNRIRMVPGPTSPYKIGDAVIGDDPFNGRHEGVVISRTGGFVGVGTGKGVFYYDHRQVRRQD